VKHEPMDTLESGMFPFFLDWLTISNWVFL
jgi:hypothetical protein